MSGRQAIPSDMHVQRLPQPDGYQAAAYWTCMLPHHTWPGSVVHSTAVLADPAGFTMFDKDTAISNWQVHSHILS